MRAPGARLLGAALIVAALAGAWFLFGAAAGYTPLVVEPDPGAAPGGARWRGAIHVHSDYSGDARGSIEQIAAAAERAGLDFVVVADHTRADGSAGRHRDAWIGSVLVVSAEEISTAEGHLLALGNPAHRYAYGPEARQAVDDILGAGGAALVAHPFGGEVAWDDAWAGTAGLEVLSYSGALYRLSWPRRLVAFARFLVSPDATGIAVLADRDPALARWDALTRLEGNAAPRPFAAVGAVDAHGPLPWLGVPSYESLMRSVITTAWLPAGPAIGETPRRQADAVRAALVAGRAAVVVQAVGSAPGFGFTAERAGERPVGVGTIAAWTSGWTLRAGMGAPGPYRLVLLADGVPVAEAEGEPLAHSAARAATYRVEAYRTDGISGAGAVGFTPWIVSNPIYLWPAEVIANSHRRRAPALPAPPPDLDLFAVAGWAAEHGGAAMSAIARAEPGLRWDLRVPDRDPRSEPYAAVAWRPEGGTDWSAAAGLSLRLRSEDPWRVAVRLQLVDGAIWERIARSGPAERGSGMLWRDFRLLGDDGRPVPGRELDPAAVASVQALLLMVTPEMMKPHSEARIEVLAVGPFGSRP